MNIREGARRMRYVGQWMILIPLSILLVVWGTVLANALITRSANGMTLGVQLLIPGVLSAVPGAALWAAAWILEGFGKGGS
jgi:hypothetical protein